MKLSAAGVVAVALTITPSSSSVQNCVRLCHYVDATMGSDGNAGTRAAPWRTIQHAADLTNPGDTVLVSDGIYTGGSNVLRIARSGAVQAWLVFRAVHRWKAVIDGRSNNSTTGIEINGSYIRVEGFEVRNTSRYGIDAYAGGDDLPRNHDIDIVGNHVHDIGRVCTGDKGGRVGIDAYADNLVIERNVVHDVGRLGPGEQGCEEPNRNWQNHDHGIYHGVGNNVVIRNNVFYHLAHGWAVHRYNGGGAVVQGLTIANNTFIGANPWREGQVIVATATTGLLIVNNIFYRPTGVGISLQTFGLSDVTVSHNLAFGAPVSVGGTGIELVGNLDNKDPLFVDAENLDFHVQASSPTIGAGVTLSMVLDDFDGYPRAGASAYTLGAYQQH